MKVRDVGGHSIDKYAVLNILREFQTILEAKGIKPSKLILYGSYAHENYTEASDIDVVIVSDDFSGMDYWQRIEVLTEAIYEIFEPIEAVAMTPEEWEKGDSFVCDFAGGGEVLYGGA